MPPPGCDATAAGCASCTPNPCLGTRTAATGGRSFGYVVAVRNRVSVATALRRLGCLTLFAGTLGAQSPRAERGPSIAAVPLPEHPRPDFQRAEWLNLNGRWRFAFDPGDIGERSGWPNGGLPAGGHIVVPFSWGAPPSGVPGSGNVGWYAPPLVRAHALGRRGVFGGFWASAWR